MKLRSCLPALVLGLALAAAGCAAPAEETADPATTPTPTASASSQPSEASTPSEPATPTEPPATREPRAPRLEVTVSGADVGPNAEEISLEVGEPLLLAFDSDRAGELHVHSKPEQYVQFEAGRSEQELVVETPGTVEVEDHGTGAVVAILEVS